MEEESQKSANNTSDLLLPVTEQSAKTSSIDAVKVETNSDSNTELSHSPKRLKKTEEDITTLTTSDDIPRTKSESQANNNHQSKPPIQAHYQDMTFNAGNASYCSFSSTTKKPSESTLTSQTESTSSKPIQQLLDHAAIVATPELDSDDEDEQRKKIAAAKKLLFPGALATSFPEVSHTLRNERRQEFCPIYKDDTPEQMTLRQSTRKPVGSLLAKRIRWDDLKRKREDDEREAKMQFRYGPYGPVYNNQESFANPYEKYYTAMQNQYDLMVKMTHAQHEHSGFWPEYQQPSFQNNDQLAQNSMQHQIQPYTYPYSSMNSNLIPGMNTHLPISYTSTDYSLHMISHMQPPPPPPDEP